MSDTVLDLRLEELGYRGMPLVAAPAASSSSLRARAHAEAVRSGVLVQHPVHPDVPDLKEWTRAGTTREVFVTPEPDTILAYGIREEKGQQTRFFPSVSVWDKETGTAGIADWIAWDGEAHERPGGNTNFHSRETALKAVRLHFAQLPAVRAQVAKARQDAEEKATQGQVRLLNGGLLEYRAPEGMAQAQALYEATDWATRELPETTGPLGTKPAFCAVKQWRPIVVILTDGSHTAGIEAIRPEKGALRIRRPSNEVVRYEDGTQGRRRPIWVFYRWSPKEKSWVDDGVGTRELPVEDMEPADLLEKIRQFREIRSPETQAQLEVMVRALVQALAPEATIAASYPVDDFGPALRLVVTPGGSSTNIVIFFNPREPNGLMVKFGPRGSKMAWVRWDDVELLRVALTTKGRKAAERVPAPDLDAKLHNEAFQVLKATPEKWTQRAVEGQDFWFLAWPRYNLGLSGPTGWGRRSSALMEVFIQGPVRGAHDTDTYSWSTRQQRLVGGQVAPISRPGAGGPGAPKTNPDAADMPDARDYDWLRTGGTPISTLAPRHIQAALVKLTRHDSLDDLQREMAQDSETSRDPVFEAFAPLSREEQLAVLLWVHHNWSKRAAEDLWTLFVTLHDRRGIE